MIAVPLTKGKQAFVSAEDADRVLAHKWFCADRADGRTSYACREVNGSPVYLHRFLMQAAAGQIVDHANGDGLDNRRENLRIATHSQNSANCAGYGKASRFKGVYPNRGGKRWHAKLMKDGVTHRTASFDTEVEAAEAYDELATLHHGGFARVNFEREAA